MMDGKLSCRIFADQIPVIKEALDYADEFLLTAAGQKNRNHVGEFVSFENVSFAMEEVLFDPQTSGGLLLSIDSQDAGKAISRRSSLSLPCAVIGRVINLQKKHLVFVK